MAQNRIEHPIAVAQGTLSESADLRLGGFPGKHWRGELELAAALDLDAIEWVLEADGLAANPLWTTKGREEIRKATAWTGVRVRGINATFFAVHPLDSNSESTRLQNAAMLRRLIGDAADVGAEYLILPLAGCASTRRVAARDRAVRSLEACLHLARARGIALCVEQQGPGADQAVFLSLFDEATVGAYYDTGRALATGADPRVDVLSLVDRLKAVGLSRPRVSPGAPGPRRGAADTGAFLGTLLEAGFDGGVTLRYRFRPPAESEARVVIDAVRTHLRAHSKGCSSPRLQPARSYSEPGTEPEARLRSASH
jgi:sugar phosphate isomerase/epimerase